MKNKGCGRIWKLAVLIIFLSSNADARTNIAEDDSAIYSRYVWEEGMDPVFNLIPMNFDTFYYDIDNNAGSEFLSIDLGSPAERAERTIGANKITYTTSAFNISFRYSPFGNYSAIGFMGDKYLAAYTEESRIATKPVKLLIHRLLSRVLIDEKENHTIIDGKNLTLDDGYSLRVKDANITAGTAIISFEKNGIDLYHRPIKPGNTLIYEREISRVKTVTGNPVENPNMPIGSVPIIAVHMDSVIAKGEKAAVVINGIFQLSDTYTDIDPKYGSFGITQISETSISMKNRIKSGLSVDRTGDFIEVNGSYISPMYLIGNIRLKAAASDSFRFYVYDEHMAYERHERRGAVYTESNPVFVWDGLNFPGFWYDLDSNSFSEKLEIKNISERKIPKGDLKYTLSGVKTPLAITRTKGAKMNGINTSYTAFGLGTNRYIAVNGTSEELSKILIGHTGNTYEKKTLIQDEIWELGEGYNLTVKSIDAIDSSRKALLSFSHNGDTLKEKWVQGEGIFTYPDINLSSMKDVPKFTTYLDAVFAGCCFDMIQLQYTFLVSDNITKIHEGDRAGIFRVTGVEPDFISMESDRMIYLRPGSNLNLIENLSFKVADAPELRFYPTNMMAREVMQEVEEESSNEKIAANRSITNVSELLSMNKSTIEKTNGFGIILVILTLLTVYLFNRGRL